MNLKLLPRINSRILKRFGLRLERTRPSRHMMERMRDTDTAPPIEAVADMRFRTNDWTYSAPIELMVSRPIFGYGSHSWHPLKAGALQLLEDIEIPYESSVLPRFYQAFTPNTITEAYCLGFASPLDGLRAATLFEPWALPAPPYDDPHADESPPGTPLFGPRTHQEGLTEWERLRRSVSSVLDYGYQPELFPRGRIGVTVLRSRGEERYLVGHGIHRTSVLAAMGATRVAVGIRDGMPGVADEDEAELWPHVKSGFLSVEQAVAVFRRFFPEPDTDPALEIAAACDPRHAGRSVTQSGSDTELS